MEIVAAVILYVAFATTSNHSSFDEVDEESYSNFSSYPTAAAAPGEFSAGRCVRRSRPGASTEVFGSNRCGSQFSHRVRSGRYMPTTGMVVMKYNGADAGFFVSDGPILPPPTEMEPEEGFTLREWRR
ncbi:hypothetical protein OIU76_027802 [Salix suchowensis]|nr:hypothetical protein OIU76_027802 [Salix suchowensis]